uniref:Uncharacterized protein n=1 Tax=Candidatus Kentrum sp. FW TaxID=2126338 RepID=A0A450TWW2_9GAMM|nr:MAG: hypothetical protein BECKFW1821C_GA0114237_105317 [Candidatus Kentron sp. FW]
MTKKSARKIISFDWATKTVLRDKANFDVLEGFPTALLKRPHYRPRHAGGRKQSAR